MFLQPIGDDVRNIYKNYQGEISLYQVLPVAARKSSGMSLECNGGLRTEQIADIINQRRLCVRKDGQPVTSAQVYAVVMHHLETIVKAEERIMLLI